MSEPSPTRSRIADVEVAAPDRPWEALEDLEAKELRLYALGVGRSSPGRAARADRDDPRATIDEDLDAG